MYCRAPGGQGIDLVLDAVHRGDAEIAEVAQKVLRRFSEQETFPGTRHPAPILETEGPQTTRMIAFSSALCLTVRLRWAGNSSRNEGDRDGCHRFS